MSTDAPRPRGPLYSFALPVELLSNLQPRQLHIPESHPLYAASSSKALVKPSTPPPPAPVVAGAGGAFTCALTGASFPDLAGLRDHYRTDWYKYNVKLRMQGKPTGVGEEEFNRLVDGLSASISGSDSASSSSSSDDSSTSSTNAVSRLLAKQKLATGDSLDPIDEVGALSGPRSAVIWYEAPEAAPGAQYGVYRAVLPNAGAGKKREDGDAALEELRGLQIAEGKGGEGKKRQWTLLMFGGGHFAGMVVSLVPKLVSKGKGKEKEREVVVIKSKTFHRYTTRRKQGGGQGANDNANGKANSMGAQLRRHNEQAIIDEVRELLISWTQEINDSELVFLRCSKSNTKPFYDYEDAPLKRKDPRIRGYSFPTKRPTINELIRAFTELTRVKVSHLSPEALAQLDKDYLASIKPAPTPPVAQPKPIAPKPVLPKFTKEEEIERDRWTRLVDMVKKGRVEVLSTFLDKYGPEIETGGGGAVWGALPGWMEESRTTPTLLHVASAADQAEMVRWLLVEKRADPTLEASVAPSRPPPPSTETSLLPAGAAVPTPTPTPTTSSSTRPSLTPYELAPSRATRNVFRLLTTQYPDWWDWTGSGPTGARVPSGLDEEKEAEKESKKSERRGKLRDKLKERAAEREQKEREEKEVREREEKERKEKEEAELKRRGASNLAKTGPQRLGGGPPRAMLERQEAGLSEEQRMRVMREQRARAAEARFGKDADALPETSTTNTIAADVDLPSALAALTSSLSREQLLTIFAALTETPVAAPAPPPVQTTTTSHTLELLQTDPFLPSFGYNLGLLPAANGGLPPSPSLPLTISPTALSTSTYVPVPTRSGRVPQPLHPADGTHEGEQDRPTTLFTEYLNFDWPEEDEEDDPDFRVDDLWPTIGRRPRSKTAAEKAEAKEERKARNRAAAAKSKMRRKAEAEASAERVKKMEVENVALREKVEELEGKVEEARAREREVLERREREREAERELRDLRERAIDVQRHGGEEERSVATRSSPRKSLSQYRDEGSRSEAEAVRTSEGGWSGEDDEGEEGSEESEESEESSEEGEESEEDDDEDDSQEERAGRAGYDLEAAMAGLSAEGRAKLQSLLQWAKVHRPT
ncbi:hypothetical protein MNV49_005751 [Pseudohyphozyma bogoriensis]|nr:hypothetical protein MNV49_005751 [Pseudohyphozyma bogoriensis]